MSPPLLQDGGELPHHTAALFTVLTGGEANDVLALHLQSGAGRLFVAVDAFVAAMARANAELLSLGEEDDEAKAADLPRFSARRAEIDSAWLASTDWPQGFVGIGNRLNRLGTAAVALQKGQPLWAWYGPAVPMRELAVGHGSYPAAGR